MDKLNCVDKPIVTRRRLVCDLKSDANPGRFVTVAKTSIHIIR